MLSTASPPPMENFADYLGVAAIRHACGADTTIDRLLLERELVSAQCSETSEAANYAGTLLGTPTEVLSAQYARTLKMDAAGFETFCAALGACEPTEADAYDPSCEDALRNALGG